MDVASARLSGSCDAMASPCAVQTLPVEILRRIVGMSIDEFYNRYAQLEALATVSHQWRDVIMDDAMLWNDVRVSTGTTHGQISTLLRRSAGCNLSLEIKGALDSSALTSAELAIGQYQQIVQLDVGLDTDAWPPQITRRLTDASVWPELQYLSLSHFFEGGIYSRNSVLELSIHAPRLHTLALSGVHASNWSFLSESLPNLRYLTVAWISSTAYLLPALPRFPGLRGLTIMTSQASQAMPSADIPPSFSLPHLESLKIDVMELRADLLSALVSSSPQLTSLSVRFYSVAVRQIIELASPQLTELRIENVAAAFGHTDLPPPIHFRAVPLALNTLELIGVIGDIPTMISPSLRRLQLADTNIDVERLGLALSQCKEVDELSFSGLRCTSPVVRSPQAATVVLPRLAYAVLDIRPNQPLNDEVQRLFIRLLPPTVAYLKISGTPGPSSDDLRPVLEDIDRLAPPTQLSLSITDGKFFSLEDGVSRYRRMFNIDSGAEYLEILLSRPAFFAHIRKLVVNVAHATQIVRLCAGSLPLLEELRISYFSDVDQPYDKDKIQDALQALVETVPSPIACPRFKTLAIHVFDNGAPITVLLPVALKRALAALFSSNELCIEYTDLIEWVE